MLSSAEAHDSRYSQPIDDMDGGGSSSLYQDINISVPEQSAVPFSTNSYLSSEPDAQQLGPSHEHSAHALKERPETSSMHESAVADPSPPPKLRRKAPPAENNSLTEDEVTARYRAAVEADAAMASRNAWADSGSVLDDDFGQLLVCNSWHFAIGRTESRAFFHLGSHFHLDPQGSKFGGGDDVDDRSVWRRSC